MHCNGTKFSCLSYGLFNLFRVASSKIELEEVLRPDLSKELDALSIR